MCSCRALTTALGVVAFTALAYAPLVSATVIAPSTWGGCVGAGTCTIGSAALNAAPVGRAFKEKTVAGEVGLGISGGRTSGEIDIGEFFNVSYSIAESVSDIRIVFIYNGPEFRDVAELAEVTVNGATTFRLSVSGTADDTASWSGIAATVSSCGSTTDSGSGCFDISNPFGSLAVTSLSFTALPGGAPLSGAGTNESDFSIGLIRGELAVPEPGTLALLGAGLAALGWVRRRTV